MAIDKMAAISEIFNKIINNCKGNYSIGAYTCIDERYLLKACVYIGKYFDGSGLTEDEKKLNKSTHGVLRVVEQIKYLIKI